MKLRAGDVIAVPIGTKWALGKVIFVSDVYRDLVAIKFAAYLHERVEEVDLGSVWKSVADVYYTGARGANKRGWRRIATEIPEQEDQELTFRISGQSVWRGDERLRQATREDERNVRRMLVFGHQALEEKLAQKLS